MSTSLPFLSVVVPAYNRPAGLTALFAALEEQSYPPYRFEVLVCDDGSSPPLAELVQTKGLPFAVSFLREANAGPATARNRGIQAARGAIVAFTDDDCLPQPHWLEAIAEAMADPAVYAVHGPTFSPVPPIEPFIHAIDIQQVHGVATANFAVRKQQLLAVGGFDEQFRVPYFEDEDLSRRLQQQYGPITWAQEARVEHPPRNVPFRKAFRSAAYYRFLPYMQRKHAGYWPDAIKGIARRAAVKAVLAIAGVAALLGAPAALGLAWLVLLSWQARRLNSCLAQAVRHRARIPVISQAAFVLFEWTLDFVRVASYVRGLALRPVEREPGLEELLH